jgi:serine/threonine protein kinase
MLYSIMVLSYPVHSPTGPGGRLGSRSARHRYVSTFTSEPGTRLGGRYRLEDRVAAAAGWAAWKAIDETLARPVTVLTFAPGFPRLREVVTAARAASRLNDSRFAQVFDVEDDWDHAYIVMEWAAGETLDDMLAAGPLEAARGARIIAEAAEAISAAHAAGLAHLCLGPDSLRWTAGGGVKITGLGINAALSAATAEDPAGADTHRLGMLLYAALTAHWPGPDSPTLPPAPVADGLPRSPRQVRAGVPAALDEITSRVLLLRDRDGGPAVTTPAQLSTALMAAIPPLPIPQLPQSPRTRGDSQRQSARTARAPEYGSPDEKEPGQWPPDGNQTDYWSPDGQRRRSRERPASGLGGAPRAVIVAIVAVLVAAGLAYAAYHSLHGTATTPRSSSTHHTAAPRTNAGTVVLRPVGATGFNENRDGTPAAIDNDPTTFWATSWYVGNPVFGGLKQGSGLMLDMGHSVRLSSVTVTFGSIPGANVEIKIGNSNAQSPAGDNAPNHNLLGQQTADSMTTVASETNVSGTVTFTVTSKATGRYVLIWFTTLPPYAGHPNEYQAQIYNVVVKGS